MGTELLKGMFVRGQWKDEIPISLLWNLNDNGSLEDRCSKTGGWPSAVFWPEPHNLEEEFSDYRSCQQKNKAIRINLSQITINDSIPKLFILSEEAVRSHRWWQENAKRSWNQSMTFMDDVTSRVTKTRGSTEQQRSPKLSWNPSRGQSCCDLHCLHLCWQLLQLWQKASGSCLQPRSWLSNCSGAWSVLTPGQLLLKSASPDSQMLSVKPSGIRCAVFWCFFKERDRLQASANVCAFPYSFILSVEEGTRSGFSSYSCQFCPVHYKAYPISFHVTPWFSHNQYFAGHFSDGLVVLSSFSGVPAAMG